MSYKRKRPILTHGVGVNDADYSVTQKEHYFDEEGKRKVRVLFQCPYHKTWEGMLRRGYSENFKNRCRSYIDCSVVEEWHLFSNFRAWMVEQDWQGKVLDKDILIVGNKVYGPHACVFVTQRVNVFIVEHVKTSPYIGANWETKSQKYRSQCNSVTTGKQIFLGYFDDPFDAHNTWMEFKLKQALILIEEEKLSPVIAAALINRYKEAKRMNWEMG